MGTASIIPPHAGAQGAAEYQDVQAGAKFLQALKSVDPKRIGIWGGSYGGYLTGLALARNSDVFKAGVDLMGVHDMSRTLSEGFNPTSSLAMQIGRYEKGDLDQAMKVAFESSPVADVAHWKSPVLLIQGDDDRNVQFQQTVDLAARLRAHHVPYEEWSCRTRSMASCAGLPGRRPMKRRRRSWPRSFSPRRYENRAELKANQMAPCCHWRHGNRTAR